MPPRYSVDALVALHARTLGDEDDEAVIEAHDEWNDAFGGFDWRAMEHEVVEAFAWQLDDDDILDWSEDEAGRVTPIRNGVAYPVPLTGTGSDRYVMYHSLAELLKDRYQVLMQRGSLESDTHCFLVLPHAQAAEMRQRHGKWMARHLETMSPGVDGFSGLAVPWYGHEDVAPDFARKRAAMDQATEERLAGRRREIDAYVSDLRASERGELPASENFLFVRVRQERAAWLYFVAALASAVATLAGRWPTLPGTGWGSVTLLVGAGLWHAELVRRMRMGWRPPLALRFVPAMLLLVVAFTAPWILVSRSAG